MLSNISREGIKTAFEYLSKLPLSKSLLHRLSEAARGKYIAFFSLHRILDEIDVGHPHFMNRTAITYKQAQRLLTHINHRLPFVSLVDSLEYLKGQRPMAHSLAVLLIEVPYVKTMKLIRPLLEEYRIPATVILNTDSVVDGHMPWTDEITYRIGSTTKKELSLTFLDRSFLLNTAADRMAAASHVIEHLRQRNPDIIKTRMKQIQEALPEVAVYPVSERICTMHQLEKIALNPLFSFASAGKYRLPFFDISLEDAQSEIVDAMMELRAALGRSLAPVFYCSLGIDKRKERDVINLMMSHGLEANIGRTVGVCRPGDNLFRLHRLPFIESSKGFEQYELQGLSDAIDEFLMVTMAKVEGL